MNNAPIGIFDSGMGGLTVWREIRRMLGHESLYYFGDGKNCPYGYSGVETVRDYVLSGVERMVEAGIKMLVLACNTATNAAVDVIRDKYGFPVIGIEPAVKPAALSSETGTIAVLATEGSLKGDMYNRSVETWEDKVRILSAVGQGFAVLVENDGEDTPEAESLVRPVLEPLLDAGADRIVLGCTHYPLLSGVLHKIIGDRPDIQLIDPAPAIARRVEVLLEEYGLSADPENIPSYIFDTFAGQEYRQRLIAKAEKILSVNYRCE